MYRSRPSNLEYRAKLTLVIRSDNGIIVSKEDASRAGILPDRIQLNETYGGPGYPALFEVFHQLHCLVRSGTVVAVMCLLKLIAIDRILSAKHSTSTSTTISSWGRAPLRTRGDSSDRTLVSRSRSVLMPHAIRSDVHSTQQDTVSTQSASNSCAQPTLASSPFFGPAIHRTSFPTSTDNTHARTLRRFGHGQKQTRATLKTLQWTNLKKTSSFCQRSLDIQYLLPQQLPK